MQSCCSGILLLLALFSADVRAQQSYQKLSLRESIDTALEQNLDLKVVRSGERIAGYRLDAQEARFDPAFTSAAGYSNRRSPSGGSELEGAIRAEVTAGAVGVGIEKPTTSGATLALRSDVFDERKSNSTFSRLNPEFNSTLSLDLRQPLLHGAGFTYNLSPIRLAELAVDQTNLEAQTGLLAVLRETEFAYWLAVATGRAGEIRRNSIALGELILEEAVERKKASLATQVDVLEAEAAVAEKHEALLSSVKLHKDAKDRLFVVMGILQTHEPGALILEELPTDGIYTPDPRESFDRALAHSPIRLIALTQLRRRELERRVAKQDQLPALDLAARSGILGRDASQGQTFTRLTETDGYFWEVNLEFRLPWGRRAEKARYAEAVTQLEQQRTTTDQVTLQLYADIREACRLVVLANERIDATRVTEDLQTKLFEQRQTEQRSGQTTTRLLLEAQEDMEEAQLRHLEAKVELLDAIARLAELEGTLPGRYGLVLAGNRTAGGE